MIVQDYTETELKIELKKSNKWGDMKENYQEGEGLSTILPLKPFFKHVAPSKPWFYTGEEVTSYKQERSRKT